MDRDINQLLSFGALGLVGFIVFKLVTRKEIQTFVYAPFFGYADDKNNTEVPLYKGKGKPQFQTVENGQVSQIGENLYQYEQ
jgi:hypothetical protein